MKKTKLLVAILIVVALLMCNIVMLLNNTSIAVQNDVTVVIDSETEHSIALTNGESSGQVLTYTCADDSTFNFRVLQDDTPLTITKTTLEPEPGVYNDVFIIEHINSNENVVIEGTDTELGKIGIWYGDISLGMWDEDENGTWLTTPLISLADENHYQFVIKEYNNNPGNPGEPGNPGQPGEEPIADTTYDVNFGTASWEVFDKTITASVQGKVINNGQVQLKGDEVIKLSNNYDSRLMETVVRVVEPEIEEERWFTARLAVNENYETSLETINAGNLPNDKTLVFIVQDLHEDGPEMPQLPEGNTDATFTISSDAEHAGSYVEGLVRINGYEVQLQPPPGYQEGDPIPASAQGNVRYMYNDEGKVTLTFEALFIKKYVGTITVNGTEYEVEDYIDYTDRTDWLDHYGRQCLAFEIPNIDYAENYNVVMNLEDQEGKDQYIGNFLWTIDPRAEGTDEYIGHSRLELVKVVYWMNLGPNEEEITVNAEDVYDDPYIEYDPDGMIGSLVVPEGALCTMRIIPDYGYQVTSFGVNGNDIITGDEIAEFSFPIHKGNFHLRAQVTEVNDEVDAKSEKVKAGNIELSKNELDAGSAVLTVDDIEPSKEKIEKFEEVAGEYKISSYLDIDLDQVIYKGTAEDYWSNRIHELREEATITLQLEEGIDGNDVVIIHNVDDGDEYEVIEITSYDPETNTITFKTKSFSNYAIASKTTKEETYTISTGDYILVFTDLEGHEFEATVVDIMKLTDAELAEMGITREEYEKVEKIITESVKGQGTLLAVYNIMVEDDNYEHSGKVYFKIKMTDEMKKYNIFKLININEDDFSAKDVVELKVNGEYLEGTLPHLSVYALVADTEKTANPTTGDDIIKYIAIFAAATAGVVIIAKVSKKNNKRK